MIHPARTRLTVLAAMATVALSTLATGCGEDASFGSKTDKSQRASGANLDTTGEHPATDPVVLGDAEGTDPATVATGDTEEPVLDSGSTADANPEALPDVPGADPKDLPALKACMAKWKDNPFQGQTVQNFRRIAASVTVGGFGNAINDTTETPAPFLILIDAGVNVLGAPTYNLLNPNGYYCMKVNVNVMTSLTVKLHCNAHLADSKVDVNVLSTTNDSTSAVGVHVLSDVEVQTIRPEGDSCIR